MKKNVLKTVMSLLFIFGFLTVNAQNQKRKFFPFVEIGIDPKMAAQGPYKGKVNDTNGGTFNAEFKIGFEFNKQLFGLAYETHKAIKYEKISVFYDHKFNNSILFLPVKRFTTRLGGEAGAIIRKDPPEDHRKVTTDLVQLGINLGVYYRIFYNNCDTGFEIGVNYNAFRGEEHYRSYQKTFIQEFRNDFMFVLKRNF